jgi:CheY-like chemotaxis protein
MDNDAYIDTGGRATPEQMTRQHVYVVNGSPDFLDVIRELLQDEHYNVTTTNFVPLSFETIEAARPALLVIDLVLGERAGWELLHQLRVSASTRGIPVLLVSTTARLLDDAKEKYKNFGETRYLIKPFDLDDLLALIHDMIGVA